MKACLKDWPADGLERVEVCPICKGKKRKQLYVGLTDRVFRCAPGHWDMYQCLNCGTAYLDPRPTPATIHLAYQSYYTHNKPVRQETMTLPRWRRYIRALANGYRNSRYRGKLQPSNRVGAWLLPFIPKYRQALDRELRYLPPLPPDGRLLDVGFGSGDFLTLAQRVGWRVAGVDPDPVTVANAIEAGLDVRQGGIDAFTDAVGQFDVITLSHVIEHVHDPVDTIRQAYALLKPGGQLYIETPNIDAYGHQRFKESWRGLEPPRHLTLFNWSSMNLMLKECGFQTVRSIYSFAPYAKLAHASKVIREGGDPYQERNISMVHRVAGIIMGFSPFTKKEKTEFITVIAKKPESQ